MSDTVEASRQDMDEESSDELSGFEGHGFVAILCLMAIILPLEGDAALIVGDQPAIGDGDPMGLSGQVSEYGLGAGKGTFSIDYPVDVSEWLQVIVEGLGISQCLVLSEELQLSGGVSVKEFVQKQTSEQSGQDPHWQEEPWPTRLPMLSIVCDAATGDDAVDMGMMSHGRAPGMQHHGDADTCAEVFGIGGNGEQGFAGGLEQQMIDQRLVLIGDI